MPSISMTSTCDLCCIIVGPFYTMTAQQKTTLDVCLLLVLLCNCVLLCKTKVPAECPK